MAVFVFKQMGSTKAEGKNPGYAHGDAVVAVEQTADLDQEFTVPPECVGIEGSSIYLQVNERVSMRGLLYGLLLQSGNDAAVAVACRVAGDIDSLNASVAAGVLMYEIVRQRLQ